MFAESVISYSGPKGDGDFEDVSYDGIIEENKMFGGLGQLVDSLYGNDDFLEEQPTG